MIEQAIRKKLKIPVGSLLHSPSRRRVHSTISLSEIWSRRKSTDKWNKNKPGARPFARVGV